MLTRRGFIKSGGLALFSTGLSAAPLFLSRAVQAATPAQPYGRQKVVVTIFLRGGMDGVMAVTPYTDKSLASLRPKLLLPLPESGKENALLDLDGRFGLHPAFAPLTEFYKDGSLAIVHGAGNPFVTRSHLDAAQYWESGTPGDKNTSNGWMNRALKESRGEKDSPFRSVAFMADQPRTLHGDYPVLTLTNLNQFGLKVKGGDDLAALAQTGFDALYQQSANGVLQQAGNDSLEAMRLLSETQLASYQPAKGVVYPKDYTVRTGASHRSLGASLRQIAQLIKADVGLQAAYAETTGFNWDTHVNAQVVNEPFAFTPVAADFAQSVAAFWADLGAHADDVVLVTMTEFGRNVVQNETAGADHGRATAMFVMGAAVKGGKVYGSIPDRLEQDALEDQMDLPVTTDYRSVIAEVTGKQFGIKNDKQLFPGWDGHRLSLLS